MDQSNRLRWQCRRGMLELDHILEGYLDQEYPAISPQQQQLFEALLETPDPVLNDWLLGNQPAPPQYHQLIAQMTGREGRPPPH